MYNVRSTVVIAAALLSLGCLSAAAQSSQENSVGGLPTLKKIYGYKDQRTGIFHPIEDGQEISPDATTTAPTTGTIVITTTITLKTALPTGGAIYCQAEVAASSISATGVVEYTEDASVKATVSGSTATCTAKVPYSWVLPAASTTTQNTYDATLSIFMVPSSTVTTSTVFTRDHSQTIITNGKIPATGTTTTFTESVVL